MNSHFIHTDPQDPLRHPDGSIGLCAYRAIARRERAKAIVSFWRRIGLLARPYSQSPSRRMPAWG